MRRTQGRVLLFIAMASGITTGLAGGIGGFTFFYAKGASYMSNDAAICANCHVMQGHYDGWMKGSHRNVAVCNDCHTPHNPVGKYFTKALNGYHHSKAFTLQNFHEPIQITPRNRAITEEACRYCHQEIVEAIDLLGPHQNKTECIRCHASVGHLELEQ